MTEVVRTHEGKIKIWLQAVRIFSFTASIVPVLVGSALAWFERSFDVVLFLLILVASVLTHAGANLANDYFDHVKGIDTVESLGPSKVIQQELLSSLQVAGGAAVSFAIATVLGLLIVAETGWIILAVALASLAAAVLYTGGPKPLGYIALGEVLVFAFMGPVMICGTYYVMTESLTLTSFLVSLPVGFLVAAILHANNIRDIEFDQDAGKMTLASKFGRTFANREYLLLLSSAYLAFAAVLIEESALWPIAVVLVTLPLAISLIRIVFSSTTPLELNGVLRKTAGLHLRFGLLLSVGIVAASLFERYG